MKRIHIIAVFPLMLALTLTSCQKKNVQSNPEYNVELVTVNPQPKTKNRLKKAALSISNFFNLSDDKSEKRARAVMANYKYNKIIKIGIASSWEKNVTDAHDAVMLALNQINENGGVAGARIELVEGDDDANVNTGTRLAYRITDDREIFAVLGHAFSDVTTPASLIYSYYGIPLFCPISTSHMITRQRDSMIFRNIPDDIEFGKTAADFCQDMGWSNVAIVYLDATFGESIANQFELECGSSNITVVTRDSFTLTQTESEYKNLFKKWKNNYKFDSIFVIGNMPQISQIVNYLREAGLNQPIMGSDSFDDPRFESLFKDSENGRIYSISSFNNESENPEYTEFSEAFEAAYGHKPDQEGVQWYDAFMVLTDAIDQAGKPDASKVVEVLRNGTWSEAAGPYSFDSFGNMVGKDLVIKKLTKDGYKIVK